jgi:PAS domain S-box-containing protein
MDQVLPRLPGRRSPAGAAAHSPLSLDDTYRLPESALKDLISDNRFLVVPETMVDGLIVIDTVGIIHYVNPACIRLFGHDRENLIGRNVKMLMPSPFQEEHDSYLTRHRETGVKRIIGIGRELKGLKSDGKILIFFVSFCDCVYGDV